MEINVRRIKIAMLDQFLTIQHLAEIMKVHPSTISGWLSKPSKPQLKDVTKLAEVLGLTTEEIISHGETETEAGSALHKVREA